MNDRYKEDLEWFVGEKVKKLDENNYKGSWKNDSIDELFYMLNDEVTELEDEIYKINPNYGNIIKECADVPSISTITYFFILFSSILTDCKVAYLILFFVICITSAILDKFCYSNNYRTHTRLPYKLNNNKCCFYAITLL